ncbi:hypothetical protein L218DRAFT_997062 [Marasmius fiardii PR-910]|nr:hypothetical protein L218DRAFT_997062 [Marasmius fiardii PR-910]
MSLTDAKDIDLKTPSRKLSDRQLGPFELPWGRHQIHPVFHVDKLSPWRGNDINGERPSQPGPIELEEDVESHVILSQTKYYSIMSSANSLKTHVPMTFDGTDWQVFPSLSKAYSMMSGFWGHLNGDEEEPTQLQPITIGKGDSAVTTPVSPKCGKAPVVNTQRLKQRLDSRRLVPMTKMINTARYPTEYKYAPSPNDKEVKMGD